MGEAITAGNVSQTWSTQIFDCRLLAVEVETVPITEKEEVMPRNPATKAKPPKPDPKSLVESQVDVTAEPPPKPIEEEPPAPKVHVIERRIETVIVEIPLGEPPHRFQQIHLEALLYGEHAQTWARLRQALRDKDARTADGKEVRSGPDILRWLLEQFHVPAGD